jgi:hypothetical protein
VRNHTHGTILSCPIMATVLANIMVFISVKNLTGMKSGMLCREDMARDWLPLPTQAGGKNDKG